MNSRSSMASNRQRATNLVLIGGIPFRGLKFGNVKLRVYFRIARESEKGSSCNFNTLRTGDADLRFYITTVQDG